MSPGQEEVPLRGGLPGFPETCSSRATSIRERYLSPISRTRVQQSIQRYIEQHNRQPKPYI